MGMRCNCNCNFVQGVECDPSEFLFDVVDGGVRSDEEDSGRWEVPRAVGECDASVVFFPSKVSSGQRRYAISTETILSHILPFPYKITNHKQRNPRDPTKVVSKHEEAFPKTHIKVTISRIDFPEEAPWPSFAEANHARQVSVPCHREDPLQRFQETGGCSRPVHSHQRANFLLLSPCGGINATLGWSHPSNGVTY